MIADNAWSLAGEREPQVSERDQVPPQLSEAILAGERDVSDVEQRMVGEFMKNYNLDPTMFAPKK